MTGGLTAAALVGTTGATPGEGTAKGRDRAHGGRTGGSGGAGGPAVTVSDPVRLNPPGNYGYEPGVAVDPYGTIYATAHKASATNEGTRLSSWFWYSTDGGETWHDMPSAADVDNEQAALEGDIAVDGKGRVYFCDTYAADNQFNRYLTGESGPVWDYSTPMQGTTAVDDRPWLQAHGDGIVYYLGNNGTGIPAPNDDPGDTSRIWFYRSTDGGLTWSEGFGFPTPGYCSIAADKSADVDTTLDGKRVYVATDNDGQLELYHSTDAGQTWDFQDGKADPVYEFEQGTPEAFPTWSVTDCAGNPYHVAIDADRTTDEPGTLVFVNGEPGDWTVHELAPFEGTFAKQWIGAGSEGTVGIVFYGTEPGTVVVDDSTNWYAYALVTTTGQSPDPSWTLVRLDDVPVATDGQEQGDFFECAVGPADDLHVTYDRKVLGTGSGGTMSNPTRTSRANQFYVRGDIHAATTETDAPDGDTGESPTPETPGAEEFVEQFIDG